MFTFYRFARGRAWSAGLLAVIGLTVCLGSRSANADHLFSFDTTLSSDYLLISRDSVNGNTDVDVSNFELGANKAPVPATDKFLNSKGSLPGCSTCGGSGGPTLAGAVPNFPGGILPVAQGVGGHGNIAIMDSLGEFNLQNTGVFADSGIGIRVAGPNSSSINKSGDSFFNDPNKYPNTFDTTSQSGLDVDATDQGDGSPFADATTRIDHFNSFGVTYNYNHAALATEIYGAKADILGLASTGTLDVSGGGAGEIDTSSTGVGFGLSVTSGNSLSGVDVLLTLVDGLNVIDIVTGGNDFKVTNANFVFDGSADAAVIFRLPGNDNMLIDNSNILAGSSGIGLDDAIFFSSQTENDTHFNMNNVILNGAAFWSFGHPNDAELGTSIVVNNAQGCTQLLADKITLSNVRFMNCSFGVHDDTFGEDPGGSVPEPTAIALAMWSGLLLLLLAHRRVMNRW